MNSNITHVALFCPHSLILARQDEAAGVDRHLCLETDKGHDYDESDNHYHHHRAGHGAWSAHNLSKDGIVTGGDFSDQDKVVDEEH